MCYRDYIIGAIKYAAEKLNQYPLEEYLHKSDTVYAGNVDDIIRWLTYVLQQYFELHQEACKLSDYLDTFENLLEDMEVANDEEKD